MPECPCKDNMALCIFTLWAYVTECMRVMTDDCMRACALTRVCEACASVWASNIIRSGCVPTFLVGVVVGVLALALAVPVRSGG